jgi:hypothetical protein
MSVAKITIVGSITVELNIGMKRGGSFYTITNIKELLSSLPTKGSATPRQSDHGEDGGIRHYGTRYMPFEGEIHASSVSSRVALERDLRTVLSLPRVPSETDDGYREVQIEDESGNLLFTHAIVVEMPEFSLLYEGRETIGRYRFAMIADNDPFFYSQSATTDSGGEGAIITDFTLQDTHLVSLKDGSLPDLEETIVPSLTVENAGTEGSPPLITIHGPCQNPRVINVTTNREMDLDGITLASGERIEIDVANYTITKIDASNNETDVLTYLTTDSDWIFVEPGDNDFALFDDADNLNGQLEVTFRDCFA